MSMSVTVAPSFSDGIVIHYVLMLLWMTSCFHIMSLWHIMYSKTAIERDKHISWDSSQILLNDKIGSILCELCIGCKVCYLWLPCFPLELWSQGHWFLYITILPVRTQCYTYYICILIHAWLTVADIPEDWMKKWTSMCSLILQLNSSDIWKYH